MKMEQVQDLRLEDYDYALPAERIAKFPLKERSASRLLVYQGGISHYRFAELGQVLPEGSLLVFNDTRVIPARMYFTKATGAVIEIFLLHPIAPSSLFNEAMEAQGRCTWQCMVGNLKKWKGETLSLNLPGAGDLVLKASLVGREERYIEFSWNGPQTFSEVLQLTGQIPLPPYLNREVQDEDKDTYQTVYSREEGAVAAPTAGLHFTPQLIEQLKESGIKTDYLTLHVSAGTFKPITEENVFDHPMHREQVVITRGNLRNLLAHQGLIIPVGTTSMRTLESLYWYGVKLIKVGPTTFHVDKHDPYRLSEGGTPKRKEIIEALLVEMDRREKDLLTGETEIFITPGYHFRLCDGLITNFHMPKSTLILLVAALIGEDWKRVYEEALEKGYRFLSYGDSSLLLPMQKPPIKGG